MDFRKKRWISLFAGLGIEAFAGIVYVWSIFQAPLIEKYGWSVIEVSFTYSLAGLSCMLATSLYDSTGDISKGFLILGIIYLVGMLFLTLFIFSPPPEFRRQMTIDRAEQHSRRPQKPLPPSVYDVETPAMLRLPTFYLAFFMLLLMLACGGMIINQASPIMVHTFGISPAVASAIVSALAMANVAGRLLWGPLSDKIGKTGTLVLINLLLIACLLGLLLLSSEALFTAALLGVILCFGGTASLVVPLTAELFGNCHVGENYSVMFCVFGTSSLVGPPLISAIRDFTGNYTAAYFFALGFALISLVISLFLFRVSRKAASAS